MAEKPMITAAITGVITDSKRKTHVLFAPEHGKVDAAFQQMEEAE